MHSSTRKFLALTFGAAALVAVGAVFFGGGGSTARAQMVLTCDVARDNLGNLPRCAEVIKQTIPDGSPGSFTINYSIDPPGPNNTIAGSQNLQDNGSFGIPLGTNTTPVNTVLTFTEDLPAGWQLSVDCVGAGIDVVDVVDGVAVTYTGNLGNAPYGFVRCVFTNSRLPTPTSTPTNTPTRTPTNTPTVTPTSTPVVIYDPFTPQPNRGGIFQPAPQPTKTPVPAGAAPSAASPSSVRPPSTGDAGLK